MNDIDILEELANNEHIRWSNWQKYVHSKCIKNEDGSLTIPKEYVEHWEYEINTDYDDLPDNIKESDRREVRQILEKLKFSTLIAENKELKEMLKHRIEYTNKLEKDLFQNASNYVIPKSKIEAKIEEIKDKEKKCILFISESNCKNICMENCGCAETIEVLQSLLGKE